MTGESSLWKFLRTAKPTESDRALEAAADDPAAPDSPAPDDIPAPDSARALGAELSAADLEARLDGAPVSRPPEPAPVASSGAAAEQRQMTDASPASTASMPLPEPDGWTDPLSGASGPRYWERVVANEDARRQRYGRTATVALVELAGFEDERTFLGHELLRNLFTRVARVIVREVRASDHIARIGKARFGIILVETDEVSAINFVDRLRKMLLVELGPDQYFTAHIGWASPAEGGSMEDALASAADRLAEESLRKS